MRLHTFCGKNYCTIMFDNRLFGLQLRPLIELESGMVRDGHYRVKFVNHIDCVTCVCAMF